MIDYKTLKGKVFTDLTIIGESVVKIIKGKYRRRVLCRCICGVEKEFEAYNVVKGVSTDCGCKLGEKISKGNETYYESKRKYKGEDAYKLILRHYKDRAKAKNLEYSLSIEYFKTITKQNCAYCGIAPKQRARIRGSYAEYIYNGIDKVDNNKGYTEDNTVACCGVCNHAKGTRNGPDFLDWISKVYNNLKNKGELR